jgi:hypothetical protein
VRLTTRRDMIHRLVEFNAQKPAAAERSEEG